MNQKLKEKKLKYLKRVRNMDFVVLAAQGAVSAGCIYYGAQVTPAPITSGAFAAGAACGVIAGELLSGAKRELDNIDQNKDCLDEHLRHRKVVNNLKIGVGAGIALIGVSTTLVYMTFDMPITAHFIAGNMCTFGVPGIVHDTIEDIKKVKELKKDLNKKD